MPEQTPADYKVTVATPFGDSCQLTMPKPITVHILVIDHRHGRNLYAHRTEAGAHQSLVGYVREWWGYEMRGDDPCPDDDQAAIDAYFEKVEDESYSIDTYVLTD